MLNTQPGILAALPSVARYLTFQLRPGIEPHRAVSTLAELNVGTGHVVGVGPSLVAELGGEVPGLREPTCLSGRGVSVPATPAALWVCLRGDDRGAVLHSSRRVICTVETLFQVESIIDGFKYAGGRDLSGYEDGTENPQGAEAVAAAIVQGHGDGLDGSSFVAVQPWLHDLTRFESFDPTQRDDMIGRRQSDNEELEDAPESAHVKRTAQESFEPEAFLVRRSMPWTSGRESGLVFVAYGRSFDAFEAQLRRMVGLEDGIVDALFRFTRPRGTSYFWCPPVRDNHLDLRRVLG